MNTHNSDSITVRLIKDNDIDGLIALYEEVWPDVDYDKKAKANFVLKESNGINYCAEYNNKIVGSRTSFYINAYIGSRKLRCIHIGDSCVTKECRGKGLFQNMNKHLLADFFIDGDLIYNISVAKSRISYEKLGWVYIKSLESIFKILNPIRTLLKIKFDIRKLSGSRIWDKKQTIISIPQNLIDERERIFREANLIHINYDLNTIAWRQKTYSGIKSFTTSSGLIIYKIGTIKNCGLTVVEIGEMFLSSYDKKCFKNALSEFVKNIKPDVIQTNVCHNHPLYKYYRRCNFINNPKHKYLHHGVRVNSDEMRELCLNPANWGISALDIDTF